MSQGRPTKRELRRRLHRLPVRKALVEEQPTTYYHVIQLMRRLHSRTKWPIWIWITAYIVGKGVPIAIVFKDGVFWGRKAYTHIDIEALFADATATAQAMAAEQADDTSNPTAH